MPKPREDEPTRPMPQMVAVAYEVQAARLRRLYPDPPRVRFGHGLKAAPRPTLLERVEKGVL